MQGCFVLNEEYVAEQRADIYDFYLTDAANHCIRKITPDGIVTTFAGRGTFYVGDNGNHRVRTIALQ